MCSPQSESVLPRSLTLLQGWKLSPEGPSAPCMGQDRNRPRPSQAPREETKVGPHDLLFPAGGGRRERVRNEGYVWGMPGNTNPPSLSQPG